MRLYTIFDKVTGESSPIFEARNDNAAMRYFMTTPFPDGYDRSDFDVYALGHYQRDNMTLIPKDKPRLVRGLDSQKEEEHVDGPEAV